VRAVFDTNIFVSAIAFPGARAEEAVIKVAQGNVGLVVSKPIVRETHDAPDPLPFPFVRGLIEVSYKRCVCESAAILRSSVSVTKPARR
jgi:hypothetical protein